MSRKPRALVLDSWSVLAYFEDEPAGQQVADIIADAHENQIPLQMTVINVGEIWYILAREISDQAAGESVAELEHLGIQVVDVGWNLTLQAARFKSKHKMSYADCFAAALAKENRADLVTGDQEFKQLEGQVRIEWV